MTAQFYMEAAASVRPPTAGRGSCPRRFHLSSGDLRLSSLRADGKRRGHPRPAVGREPAAAVSSARGPATRRCDVRSRNVCGAARASCGVGAVRRPGVPRERREPDELHRQRVPVPAGQHVAVLLRHRSAGVGRPRRHRRTADGGVRRRSHAGRHRLDGPAAHDGGTGCGSGHRGERAGRGAGGSPRPGQVGRPHGALPAAVPRRAPPGAFPPARDAGGPRRRRIQPGVRSRGRGHAQSQERRRSGGDRARRRHLGRHARRGHEHGAARPAGKRRRGAGDGDRAGGRRRPVVPGDRDDSRRDAAQPLPWQPAGVGEPLPARLRRRNGHALRRRSLQRVPGEHDVRRPPEGRLPGGARGSPGRRGRREAGAPVPARSTCWPAARSPKA